MKCSEIQDLLSAYFDNELADDMRAEVSSHLSDCAECSGELASFERLSSMATTLEHSESPASVWAAVERSLDDDSAEKLTPARVSTNNGFAGRRRLIQIAATIAALILFGFVGWTMWHGHDDHDEMAKAIEQIATEINSDGAATILLNKFGGSEISYEDAITQVGYRPIASKGLPAGYTVENLQVLNMPCCKCTQTACKRADNSRFFIYEHDNEETEWFEGRQSRQSECCGKSCEIVELNSQLAVTWKKDNRHITLLGIRDEAELELLISEFESRS